MTFALTGHAVVSGVAIGQAHLLLRSELEIREYRIEEAELELEAQRFLQALKSSRQHLESLADQLHQSAGPAAEEVIRTHITMLQDSSIAEQTISRIHSDYCNAEWALQLQLDEILSEFRHMDDDYIRSRGDDVIQVVRLVQQTLGEQQSSRVLNKMPNRLEQTLIIAEELTPGELALLHDRGVAGVVTEHGSPYSHTAILAGSLGIPTIVGVRKGQTLIKEGEQLILDGHYGILFATQDMAIHNHYLQKQKDSKRFKKNLESFKNKPCISMDGETVQLLINAERPEDFSEASESGIDGVGLFRTEFLFLQGEAPNEESQFLQYTDTLQALGGKPLTIRTLDLGADKSDGLLNFSNLRASPNPALGLRAIRLCLRDVELFKTQLRAILRASAVGPVRCLIPMLTSVREVHMVKNLLDECKDELSAKGQAYDHEMPLGGMIEVPATVMAIDSFTSCLDFFSIGTNDLIQYALATDRIDEQVAHLYDPVHPGVVMMLDQVFKASRKANLPVSVCGELAGDRRYTRLLLALGLREFSMQPRNLLEVKQLIMETDIPSAKAVLDDWLHGYSQQPELSLIQALDQSQIKA